MICVSSSECKMSGLNLASFEIIFRLVDCVSLSETALSLGHIGDGFIASRLFWMANYTPMFQRECTIESEHGDKSVLSLVAFGVLTGLVWVSKGVLDAEFSAQFLCGDHCHFPLFSSFLYARTSSPLASCNGRELHFPLWAGEDWGLTTWGDD